MHTEYSLHHIGSFQTQHRTYQRDTTHSIVVIQVKMFQNEYTVEMYSKNLVRAIGRVLLMKSSQNTDYKPYNGDDKWPLFVNKQLYWWSTSITLDSNNDVLTDF